MEQRFKKVVSIPSDKLANERRMEDRLLRNLEWLCCLFPAPLDHEQKWNDIDPLPGKETDEMF